MKCAQNKGVPLRDVVADERVKKCQVIMTDDGLFLRGFKLINVWDETFDVTPLQLPDGKLTMHVTRSC